MIEFRSRELYADFYENTGRPLIALIGGSLKGIPEVSSKLLGYLTEHYSVLVFAYFGVGDLPHHLENIPLEYFIHGIADTRAKYGLLNQDVTLLGNSKGGEAALLLTGPVHPRVTIACVPSSHAWQGIPHGFWSAMRPRPSWTINKRPVPFLKFKYDRQVYQDIRNRKYFSCYNKALAGKVDGKARIDLSRYDGRLLLLSAENDSFWPSKDMCLVIERESGIDVTHKVLDLKGHHYFEYDESIEEIIHFLEIR